MLPDDDRNKKNEEQTASGKNASPVYELFVLGELMTGPHHGYRLYEIIQRILGPFQRLSWGTLYPLIRRLEQQGLLISEMGQHHTHVSEGRGLQRKAYRITEKGQERFFALMLEPGEYSRDYAEVFTIKLSKFVLLSPAQQLMILQQRRDYLSALRGHYAHGLHHLPTNTAISKEEMPYLLQIPDYHIHKCDAELAWIERKIASFVEEKEYINEQTKKNAEKRS